MFGNLGKLVSRRRLVQFWQNFQTSLVLLIPNCTHNRMITYTYLRFMYAIWTMIFTFHVCDWDLMNDACVMLSDDFPHQWKLQMTFLISGEN